jgi:iron-sulfur cluster assembly protein
MALDEPKDDDQVYEIDGFKYLVNKEFLDKVQPIKVDFTEMGFKLNCGVDFAATASACSGCGTSNTCG